MKMIDEIRDIDVGDIFYHFIHYSAGIVLDEGNPVNDISDIVWSSIYVFLYDSMRVSIREIGVQLAVRKEFER